MLPPRFIAFCFVMHAGEEMKIFKRNRLRWDAQFVLKLAHGRAFDAHDFVFKFVFVLDLAFAMEWV